MDEALAIANKAFDQQLEDDQSRERRGLYLRTEYDSCACEELRQQVFDLVRRDAAFLPGFIPTYFELELGRSSEQLLEYAGVPVRGKVDRVDVDAEGNAVIIDYKLSGLSAGYGFGRDDELPQRIQTDIYATLVERHFAALDHAHFTSLAPSIVHMPRTRCAASMRAAYRGVTRATTRGLRCVASCR